MIIEMRISGFLFWCIIIALLIASQKFGYETDPKEIDYHESEAELQKINQDPTKWKNGVMLAFVEHGIIVTLAITLFLAFNPYNLILGIVWTTCRISEGSIQIYNKKSYWGLLNIARQYSGSSGDEKKALIESGRNIFKTRNFIFKVAQILFSIGTLAYSILFVAYGVVSPILGWFGIVASVLYGFGNGVMLVKPGFRGLWGLGGLLILLFEIVLGGWLLFFA